MPRPKSSGTRHGTEHWESPVRGNLKICQGRRWSKALVLHSTWPHWKGHGASWLRSPIPTTCRTRCPNNALQDWQGGQQLGTDGPLCLDCGAASQPLAGLPAGLACLTGTTKAAQAPGRALAGQGRGGSMCDPWHSTEVTERTEASFLWSLLWGWRAWV